MISTREYTPRELELLNDEHSVELQLEGLFRDLYVAATQRNILNNIRLRQTSMDKAQTLINQIRDIAVELKEIQHRVSEEEPEDNVLGPGVILIKT